MEINYTKISATENGRRLDLLSESTSSVDIEILKGNLEIGGDVNVKHRCIYCYC